MNIEAKRILETVYLDGMMGIILEDTTTAIFIDGRFHTAEQIEKVNEDAKDDNERYNGRFYAALEAYKQKHFSRLFWSLP
jgi:hypothetical protein